MSDRFGREGLRLTFFALVLVGSVSIVLDRVAAVEAGGAQRRRLLVAFEDLRRATDRLQDLSDDERSRRLAALEVRLEGLRDTWGRQPPVRGTMPALRRVGSRVVAFLAEAD